MLGAWAARCRAGATAFVCTAPAITLDRLAREVALAWLLQRSPNILLIPGTSTVAHLRENLATASLALSIEAIVALDGLGEADRGA